METLSDIRQELAPSLDQMNSLIEKMLFTPHEVINSIITPYLSKRGKQLRPIIALLSAKMAGGVNDEVIAGCAALEILHNSSLIHDDVVDETELRRGSPTINSLWGNRMAVLVGDYFVSTALRTGLLTRSMDVLETISDLGKDLSTGEIDQICTVRSMTRSESNYMEIIRKKTAVLFVACAKIGINTSGANIADYKELIPFVELLGLCFQIKDDIFDYFDDPTIGKPTGNDLREGKVTLPLLYALGNAPKEESRKMHSLLDKAVLEPDDIHSLIEFAKRNNGITYAFDKMREMQQEALTHLHSFPLSKARDQFERIFDYIIGREN